MNPPSLVPVPEAIPAPYWLFILLENALFLVHIVLVNLVVGGSLLALFSRGANSQSPVRPLAGLVGGRIPLFLPIAINVGIAPLLFLQVVFGHFFYTSSVLMAVYWILVIPLLILAYYGAYYYARRQEKTPRLARWILGVTTLIFLYIGFMLVNNLTLMMEPERWIAYFENRGGTFLNLDDPMVAPRYLHFVLASVAIAGLYAAWIADRRIKQGQTDHGPLKRRGLRIFGWASLAQLAVGSWFLLALPSPIVRSFMGRDMGKSLILLLGVLVGIGAAVSAFRGKLRPTIIQLAVTMIAMIITRDQLRALYLKPHFEPSSLSLNPQYGVLVLFLVVLVAGLATVAYMLRLAFARSIHGGAQ
ncbi:MAG TPA: hypothetical protein P5186_14010 [Candidatus Paceibacterota bacterium]|nr:hypothetical protein [Verrucomicrobiota bacterium]HRY49159.1 hypothetical protein [Candidatus Paceibacterota bacterium]